MKQMLEHYRRLYNAASEQTRQASRLHWIRIFSEAYSDGNDDLAINAAEHVAMIEYMRMKEA